MGQFIVFPAGTSSGGFISAVSDTATIDLTVSAGVLTADYVGSTGVMTVGAFSGSSQANGASISGSTITFGPADNTNPGMVTIGSDSWYGVKTFKSAPNLDSLTASLALVLDASKNIATSATTATELGYVSGVTSAIQTQLNGKQASGSYITALTGDVTATGPGSVAATVAAIAGTTVSGTTGTTNVVFSAGPTLTGTLTASAITASGVITLTNTTDSTSTSTGAVILSGGIGVAKNATLATAIINAKTASTTWGSTYAKFLNTGGTLDSSGNTFGQQNTYTGAGSASSIFQIAIYNELQAGYTGNKTTVTEWNYNYGGATGNDWTGTSGNFASIGYTQSAAAGLKVGGFFGAQGNSGPCVGLIGSAYSTNNQGIGLVANAGSTCTNKVGAWITLNQPALITGTNAALIVDNSSIACSILDIRDNGTTKWQIIDGGWMEFDTNGDPGTGTGASRMGAKNSTDSGTPSTFHFRPEQAVASDAALVSTHSLRVWINNTEYKLMLVAV